MTTPPTIDQNDAGGNVTDNVNDVDTHLRAVLDETASLPESTREWLRAGLAQHLKSGKPLRACLGIDRRVHLRALRNKHLVAAASAIQGVIGPWHRCELLLKKMAEFRARQWPDHEHDTAPPERWPTLQRELWHVFKYAESVRLPGTQEQVKNILKTAGAYD